MIKYDFILSGRLLRGVMLALCCSAGSFFAMAEELPGVLNQPAMQTPQALNAVLLGVTRADDRLVAVGERGVVILSDDSGTSWRQVAVPVSTTLTAVQFIDDRHGWAVGHSGVVLHSTDGGENWALQLDGRDAAQIEFEQAEAEGLEASPRIQAAQLLLDDGPDKPFLALHFTDALNGIVTGAYGLAFQTRDGGKTWSSMMGRIPNAWGAHIYSIAQAGQSIYLAGEQGLLVRSLDGGKHFEVLESPYQGSFFTLSLMSDERLVVAGLRGTVLMSEDQGASFTNLPNPIPVSLTGAIAVADGLLLVNQAGGVLQVSADGTLRPLMRADAPLTGITSTSNGQLIGIGFTGPVVLPSIAPAISDVSAE